MEECFLFTYNNLNDFKSRIIGNLFTLGSFQTVFFYPFKLFFFSFNSLSCSGCSGLHVVNLCFFLKKSTAYQTLRFIPSFLSKVIGCFVWVWMGNLCKTSFLVVFFSDCIISGSAINADTTVCYECY